MSTFTGGPADGVSLSLRGAPRLLRVTFNPRAPKYPWDALDQPGDAPKAHERLYAYELVGEVFWYHVKGSKALRGYWPKASYRYLEAQPPDRAMRAYKAWIMFAIDYERRTP